MIERTAHLILGLPRSGTSAVAQLLGDAGIHFGDPAHFLDTAVHKHNPNFFEMEWVNVANGRVIEVLGSQYSDDFLPVEADFADPALDGLKAGIVERVRAEFGDAPRIGLKDPRFCFTFPLWRSLLAGMGYAVSAVVTLRSEAACRRSNLALEGKWADDRTWSRFFVQSLLGAWYFTRDTPAAVIDFDALMADPPAYAASLDLAGVDLSAATAGLDPQLVHQRPATGDGDTIAARVLRGLRDSSLPATAYLDYRTVAAWQVTELAPAGVRSCRAELAAAHDLIAELTRQRDAQRLHADQLAEVVAVKQAAVEHHHAAADEWERQRDGLRQHADQLAEVVAAKQAAVDHHERHAAELQRQRDGLQLHADQLAGVVTAKQSALEHHERRAAELDRQRDGLRLHAEQLTGVVAAKQSALDHHERRAAELDRQGEGLRLHAGQLAAVVAAKEAAIDHLAAEATARRVVADDQARQAAGLRSALSVAVADADHLRAQAAVLLDAAAPRPWSFRRPAITERMLRPVAAGRLVVGCAPPVAGRVRVELVVTADAPGRAALYWDAGGPFDPARRVDLGPVDGLTSLSAEVVLTEPARGFWLDPAGGAGGFSISRFRLFCVGR